MLSTVPGGRGALLSRQQDREPCNFRDLCGPGRNRSCFGEDSQACKLTLPSCPRTTNASALTATGVELSAQPPGPLRD